MKKPLLDLIVVGVLSGAHGVRGDVRVKSFTEYPEDIFTYGELMSERGDVLLDPKSARPAKDHFIVTPYKPLQKEEWDKLKGTKLHVEREALPEPEDDEFYIEDLVGVSVSDPDGNALGKVKAVLNHGAGDLLEIMPKSGGKPVLVPFTLEDVPDLDLPHRLITVATFEVWADQGPDEPDDG